MSHWKFMPRCSLIVRQGYALTLLLALSNMHAGAQGDGGLQHPFPTIETLHYSVEWRGINAGTASLRIEPIKGPKGPQWDVKVRVESVGVVSKLYKLDDKYSVHLEDQFSATSSEMDALAGRKHLGT